jgi:predicted nucleic-acid-binding protein
MLGVDAHVLVRYLVRDDELQFERARRLFQRATASDERLFVSLLVLQEAEWILRSRYRLSKAGIIRTFSALLDTVEIEFEDEPAVEETLHLWKDSAVDFSDCLIGIHNRRIGCRATATFDERAAALPTFISVE